MQLGDFAVAGIFRIREIALEVDKVSAPLPQNSVIFVTKNQGGEPFRATEHLAAGGHNFGGPDVEMALLHGFLLNPLVTAMCGPMETRLFKMFILQCGFP